MIDCVSFYVADRQKGLEDLTGCLNISVKSESGDNLAFVKGRFRELPHWENGPRRPRPIGFNADLPLIMPRKAVIEIAYYDPCR